MKNCGIAASIEEVTWEMNADSPCSGPTASLIPFYPFLIMTWPQQTAQILLEL